MIDFYAESAKTKDLYYCGNRLVNSRDRNNSPPEILLCSGNRTGGKTTWFTAKLIYDFLKEQKQFVILVRFNNQLGGIASGILEAGRSVYFPEYALKEHTTRNGFSYISIGNEEEGEVPCGFGISLNAADNIKRVSSMFLNVGQAYMDEFMSESETYLPDEVGKFLSIHTSLARGQGQQHKFLPVYMSSNATSIVNPYFSALHLTDKIQSNTKFYRGDGFVYERTYQEAAANAQRKSGIAAAFKGSDYLDYAADNTWLNDNTTGIEKPGKWGRSIYQHTIVSGGKYYGVHYYPEVGIYYVGTNYDQKSPRILTVSSDDITIKNMRRSWELAALREMFLAGAVRFQNLQCKKALSPLLYL